MQVETSYSDGRICGSIPELHIHTQAKTWPEFLANLQEAIELYREEESDFQKKSIGDFRFYLNMEHLKDANKI